ncbi:unnamed protein product [Candidula unifasciata]|uniref:C2H2-type domain-containing protein n=1 Tax=Candidula unifasciata TaxID=100452 RepID=A0A8S3YHS9_9EUPU|nr:unnamed protein product [Candidula unifasciata]
MAALECNSGQDSFSPTENGDALPEEKSLNIDYSEDLWLANSEDSSGPYAQQPNKVGPENEVQVDNLENSEGYSVASVHQSIDSHRLDVADEEYVEPQVNAQGQVWSAELSEDDGTGAGTHNPAAGYMNGSAEQNGLEFSSSGEEKDFTQLVPAGSFVEGGAVVGGENQDKTFTSLMPATALNVNGDIQPGYTSMLDANQDQMVYYSTSDQITTDTSSPMVTEESVTNSYEQSAQITVNGEEAANGEEVENAVYVSIDAINSDGQQVAAAGNFTVLSPAMLNMANINSDDQTYSAGLSGSGYQHISTLPFVQNGAYATQPSFTSYHTVSTATVVSSEDSQQQQIIQHSEYSSDHTSFGTEAAALTASYQSSAIDYNDEDDEEDDEQDEEDNSVEFSEFSCPVCSEAFADQAALDDHVNNHPPLKTFVCETCGKGFATRRYLKYHRKNHCKRAGSYEGRNELDENDPNGEVKRFSCNMCSRPFRVLKCMKVHKKKKHSIMKEYTCQNCAVTFSSSQELISHPCEPRNVLVTPRVIHYAPPPLALPSQKKKKKLKQAKPSCDICGKTFSDRISVDIHRVKHIEEELYPCDMCCEEDGTDADHLAVHFRIRFFTDDNQHILEDQKAAVASHDPSRSEDGSSVPATPVHHTGSSTPHSAPATPIYLPGTPTHPSGTTVASGSINTSDVAVDMGMQLLEQHTVSGHLLDQSGFTQKFTDFAVTQADGTTQNFTVSHYVVSDSLLVSDQGLLIGQQQVDSQLELTQQQQVYSGDFEDSEVIHDASGSVMALAPKKKKVKPSKLHMCDICNKSFGDTGKLELHYKSNHLHDRPYQCDVCEKSFFTKWKLQRHMLSHLERKPHSCPMCSKSFVERGKLEAHYRTHLGTKPYNCDQCPKAFTVKSQLSIHQRRIHSTDQPFGCLVCGKAFLWKSGLDKHMRKHTREKPYICETCGIKYSNKANLIVHMSKAHSQTYVDKHT